MITKVNLVFSNLQVPLLTLSRKVLIANNGLSSLFDTHYIVLDNMLS